MIHFLQVDFFNIQYKCQTAFEEKVIRNSLTFEFPGFQFTKAYNEYNWDGKIKLYDKRRNTIKVGLLSIVLEAIKANHLTVDISQIGNSIKKIDCTNLTENLYQHQIEAVKCFFQGTGHSITIVPTRGGKTYIASECIRLVRQQISKDTVFLFVVDSVDLLKQSMSDVCSFLKIPLIS